MSAEAPPMRPPRLRYSSVCARRDSASNQRVGRRSHAALDRLSGPGGLSGRDGAKALLHRVGAAVHKLDARAGELGKDHLRCEPGRV